MTDQQIRDLGPAFSSYLRPYHAFCNQARTAPHLDAYCRALLTDAPRKTAEPNALASGTAVRTLQKFLTTTHWDHLALRDEFQTRMGRTLRELPADDGLGTVGVIDETSDTKKGDQTPGVQRQYLGCVGKVENGIVTVHMAAARGNFRTLLDADVYVPKSWDEDRARCDRAGVPEEVVYRPKWLIALEQYFRLKTTWGGVRLVDLRRGVREQAGVRVGAGDGGAEVRGGGAEEFRGGCQEWLVSGGRGVAGVEGEGGEAVSPEA